MFKWKKSSATEVVDLAAFAQRLLHYRQMRGEFFESEAIAAGGWDLLLLLYSAEPGSVTVGSAARALGVPSADTLSAAERISHYRLATQGDSPHDWENIPLTLTTTGREALEKYLRQFFRFSEECPTAA